MPKTTPPWEIKRELLTKAEDHTDPKYGYKPSERPPEQYIKYGTINLDKPAGPTSHEVAAWVKKILKLQTIGHGGTLDPKVTGVLPVTLEEATKMVQALLYSGKEYVCVLKLHDDVDEPQIKQVLSLFEDEIYQRPPLRSSVKRQLRTRRIYYIDYLEHNGRHVLFKVGCEGGTYIRKLCYDIGEILGVGGHMQELRRSRAGPFQETSPKCVTLHDVAYWFGEYERTKDPANLHKFIEPMETALMQLPQIIVRDSAVDALCHGASLTAPGVLQVSTGIEKGNVIAIYTLKGEAIALGRAEVSTQDIVDMRHGTVATLARVLMPRNVYPKVWKTGTGGDEQEK
ncbi:RNA-guided pseudouridylation complex pseudouridine synthase subunit Cbf5 [Candidatus Bathycorpusculum sp.]|jgi:H/ACA ribonucleoprotein complex subunit 4|uniref:RNA-guided pseudouridylation complex pseudouridine synthase subunit Cbf5 n=1 Tax=Candidatus Bathycorpusculum sp. TaxID=2994959 RepID=UPI0028396F07|nr:RNA-guided pseudouridylation complex pseudouridine synthase subunit Cbf5 [Candidatus Termitimicrobium sp.]MCL2685822.1 RNA-guided pseudouridylation complex pseudouridine synthase subunit Cbf5 [Candidatus Termitimicrobium sp.]